MSLVITLYLREGIVMASDSRLTLNAQQQQPNNTIVNLAVGQSDSNYKTFLASNNVGISTYGAADIQGVPIAGYIESFFAECLTQATDSVEDVARNLSAYFRRFQPVPDTQFHVAGYTSVGGTSEQQVWHVAVAADQVSRLSPTGQQGASWGGEADILSRLLLPVALVNQQGQVQQQLSHFQIPWQFFTLQDAIDFAVFAIRSTFDAIRFQPRPKTVGGPIDVLVIKPTEAFWVQRKALRGAPHAG